MATRVYCPKPYPSLSLPPSILLTKMVLPVPESDKAELQSLMHLIQVAYFRHTMPHYEQAGRPCLIHLHCRSNCKPVPNEALTMAMPPFWKDHVSLLKRPHLPLEKTADPSARHLSCAQVLQPGLSPLCVPPTKTNTNYSARQPQDPGN